MSRTLRIHLTDRSPDLVHEFRNFGEDVYRALRDNYAVSIDEIDTSTQAFQLREIPKREVRAVAGRVREIAERYPRLSLSVDEIREGDEG